MRDAERHGCRHAHEAVHFRGTNAVGRKQVAEGAALGHETTLDDEAVEGNAIGTGRCGKDILLDHDQWIRHVFLVRTHVNAYIHVCSCKRSEHKSGDAPFVPSPHACKKCR